MSVIYGHPVIADARALRFADHVTKRNGGSGDENGFLLTRETTTRAWLLLRMSRILFAAKNGFRRYYESVNSIGTHPLPG